MADNSAADLVRMRAQLFFEGDDMRRRVSKFWLLLPLSAVIASAGIVGDSTATVIGAMIVAPLMGPILGTVLAVVLADRVNLLRCLAFLVGGAFAVIAIGFISGLPVAMPIDAATNSQVAQRVSPDLVDLIAALATGAVGSIALARDDISDTLPGVAIAISLVPPLAVVGLTLESGQPEQAAGALLLFLTNVSAILATGLVVMVTYGITRLANAPERGVKVVNRRHAIIAIVLGLIVISVPLTVTSLHIASTEANQSQVSDIAGDWATQNRWTIVSVQSQATGFLVRATGPLPLHETDSLRVDLQNAGLGAVAISIDLIPSDTVTLTGSG